MTTQSLHERLNAATRRIRDAAPIEPKVALVLGSGLGAFGDELSERTTVSYADVPFMPTSSVPGHAGRFSLGRVGGTPVIAMQGRVHLYEGYAPNDVVFGVRAMVRAGAEVIIVTNAAGGLGEGYRPGDLMLISDHINLTGQNPLVGPEDPKVGQRFTDMSVAYDAELRGLARESAGALGLTLREGVYAGLLGPSFETPAEIRMLRTLGVDAVGMSTVHEVIAARQLGARCLGISCITNLAAGLSPTKLSHDEVQETADRVRDSFTALLRSILGKLAH